ncbi:MAG: hypothetical protein R3F60_14410 [bacterium]
MSKCCLALLAVLALTLVACDPGPPALGTLEAPIAVPGSWAPPAAVLARGDAHVIRRDGSPRIADGGRCASDNPWACSCVHPACSAGLPGTLDFAAFLRRRFPQITAAGGFECCRQNTGDTAYLSVHSIGRAIDLMIPTVGGDADNTAGDEVANWLVEHAGDIGVQIIVWDRASWNGSRAPGSRLRPYGGPIPHIDHIHVELNLDGANRRTPFFTSGAINGAGACEPRCDGPVVVDADCRRGDCSAFGVTCIADPAPRCVIPSCPPRGEGAICLDERHLLRCLDGLPDGEAGDCGAFGSWCSAVGLPAGQARCVLSLCVPGPEFAPVAHRQCSIRSGHLLDCRDDGGATEVPCPAGQICRVTDDGAECGPPEPACPVPEAVPPHDDRTVCLASGEVGRCFNGNVYSREPCEPGLVCADGEGGPRCALPACLDPTTADRRVCLDAHTVVRCDALGAAAERQPCPEGSVCEDDGLHARCVGPDLPPIDAGTPLDAAAEPSPDAAPGDAAADPDGTPPADAAPAADGRPADAASARSAHAHGDCAAAPGAPKGPPPVLLCLLASAWIKRKIRRQPRRTTQGRP